MGSEKWKKRGTHSLKVGMSLNFVKLTKQIQLKPAVEWLRSLRSGKGTSVGTPS